MMRKSQQIIFWRDHKVIVFKKNGKIVRLYGKRFPNKEAQEIVNEVSEQ